MRLLVVEDEPRIAELLRTALGRAGFVADTVDLDAFAGDPAHKNTPAVAGHTRSDEGFGGDLPDLSRA